MIYEKVDVWRKESFGERTRLVTGRRPAPANGRWSFSVKFAAESHPGLPRTPQTPQTCRFWDGYPRRRTSLAIVSLRSISGCEPANRRTKRKAVGHCSFAKSSGQHRAFVNASYSSAGFGQELTPAVTRSHPECGAQPRYKLYWPVEFGSSGYSLLRITARTSV